MALSELTPTTSPFWCHILGNPKTSISSVSVPSHYGPFPLELRSRRRNQEAVVDVRRRISITASSSSSSACQVEEESKLKLYAYWGSTCCWRVIIALNLKGLQYEYKPVNLHKGEQFSEEFINVNPIGYVPALVHGGITVSDSLAILLYLEEKYPQHPLLPQDLHKKAINLQAASIVCSSIQPLQNHYVLDYIEENVSPDEKVPWVQYHIQKGFAALEKLLMNCSGKYATGDEVYLADLFLAPQLHAAITRFGVNMTEFPLLWRLGEAYSELPAFQTAMPDRQPDYVKP